MNFNPQDILLEEVGTYQGDDVRILLVKEEISAERGFGVYVYLRGSLWTDHWEPEEREARRIFTIYSHKFQTKAGGQS